LLLLNVYTVPSSYSGEALALVAVRDALADTERLLEDELEWAQEHCPGTTFRYKAVAGRFIDCLQEQIEEEQALMIIMGTPAGYGEMSQWDVGSLHALTDLSIPVLTVPKAVRFAPIHTIAFACMPPTIYCGYAICCHTTIAGGYRCKTARGNGGKTNTYRSRCHRRRIVAARAAARTANGLPYHSGRQCSRGYRAFRGGAACRFIAGNAGTAWTVVQPFS
jgi:hypothetical protein